MYIPIAITGGLWLLRPADTVCVSRMVGFIDIRKKLPIIGSDFDNLLDINKNSTNFKLQRYNY